VTRPFSATKSAFLKLYPRPVHPLYRRVVEELMVELHLDTVNQAFVYDPFFALGVMTVSQTLLEGYPVAEQAPVIMAAMCRALQLKPEILQEDAQKLTDLLKGDPHNGWLLLQRHPEAQDRNGLKEILTRIADPKYHYSRILGIGMYTAFQMAAPTGQDQHQSCGSIQTKKAPSFYQERELTLLTLGCWVPTWDNNRRCYPHDNGLPEQSVGIEKITPQATTIGPPLLLDTSQTTRKMQN